MRLLRANVQLHADNDGVIIGAITSKGVVLQGEGVILVSGTPWSSVHCHHGGEHISVGVFILCMCSLWGFGKKNQI